MARKPIPKKIREQVYKKCNGHCAYCGCELEYKDMQVDHIVSVYDRYKMDEHGYPKVLKDDEIDSIDNYLPACRQCNFYKSTYTLEVFRKSIEETLYDNLIKNFNYRLLTKYGMVKAERKPVVFYFERMESRE